MDTICIVDTSICTDNLGDQIIMDAVNEVVWDLFPAAYVYRVPSHEALSDRTRKFVRASSWCFIGGTNLLSSNIKPRGLWRLDKAGANALGSTRTVCLGTGWNDYMAPATPETAALLRTALSGQLVHSARDSYTRDHLAQAGLAAICTSCPTTWSLTPEHCRSLPNRRAHSAVFTLSAWRPDPASDRAFVDLLRDRYRSVYFFPQMQDDYAYFESFGWEDIRTTGATLEAYNHFLENEDVDFVGTRLHGGIRALQKGRRALILAIDNRAAEISRDTGLPVLQRSDTAAIGDWLDEAPAPALNLPQQAINDWTAQFREPARSRAAQPAALPEVVEGRPSTLKRVARKLGRLASVG